MYKYVKASESSYTNAHAEMLVDAYNLIKDDYESYIFGESEDEIKDGIAEALIQAASDRDYDFSSEKEEFELQGILYKRLKSDGII